MGYKRGSKPISQSVKEVKEKPIAPAVEEVIEEKLVDAIVDGVDVALNIRKNPEVKPNNQIAILGRGVKIVVVDPEKPIKNKYGEWFKIRIKDNEPNEGYAMKKYIKII